MRAPTGGIIFVDSIHISRSLVRLPGENAMAQAAGTAKTSPTRVEPEGQDDGVAGELQIVGPFLHDAEVFQRPVEEQEFRRRRETPRAPVLKLVSTIHRIGKKMRNPMIQAAAVVGIRR